VVEHYLDTVGVRGSNPLSRTTSRAASRFAGRIRRALQINVAVLSLRHASKLRFASSDNRRFDGKLYDFLELGLANSVVRSVTQSSALLAQVPEPVWFCLKTQPKREHLAATALRRQFGVECFSPRLRFRRMTQRGPVWFVEAMFPGYLFAKFVYSTQHRAVENSHGIRGIVHFGDRLATLPENVVAALQSKVGAEDIVTLDCSIKVGQSVQIIDGPFQGLEVVVTHLLPAKERIRVLFDFLGRSMELEISTAKVLAA
jgi:transcriptional antiterminator RfaH